MGFTPKTSLAASSWQELTLLKSPDLNQLDNIKAHLDLILLSLEAIANLSSEAMLQAAKELNLESTIADRVELWRLRQSNPLRKSSGGRKKLDVEEARALVLIIAYLAKQNQELLRRAVNLLEQVTEQNQEPHHTALLGDYLDKFINTYQTRMTQEQAMTSTILYQLALKLLIDLLFYSGNNGHRLLWLAILESSS
ncbi:hypothetical protein Sta7437_1250 [Stanieria cyanosphaera PCC 7437]|uniref:DUF3038 domain-containing protein n=1 Tax=Stanieria cyanosphaera (strain ATCC 29371 / PCC 7437) TaxID=111780 RepID=K9XQC2_STAC7|nr:DUF3038 domain-containing protein [Stanieria cyanosphaera]AFZ34820.1 hypothetical protein Sta7437_1250 [Stanieria cyanosphaera PCC 7437]